MLPHTKDMSQLEDPALALEAAAIAEVALHGGDKHIVPLHVETAEVGRAAGLRRRMRFSGLPQIRRDILWLDPRQHQGALTTGQGDLASVVDQAQTLATGTARAAGARRRRAELDGVVPAEQARDRLERLAISCTATISKWDRISAM